MGKLQVPEKAVRWASSQAAEFGPDEMAAALDISRRSAHLYLSRMEKAGAISRLMRGRYVPAIPSPSRKTLKIIKTLAHEMPLTRFVVWSTDSIVQFSHYIPPRAVIFVEARSADVPSVRDVLRENGQKVLAEPNARDYGPSLELGIDVFVLKMKNRWGTVGWNDNILLNILEKVFVDLYFLVTRKGFPLPKEEVARALGTAIAQKAVNRRTVRRYAMRRNVYPELKEYIEG